MEEGANGREGHPRKTIGRRRERKYECVIAACDDVYDIFILDDLAAAAAAGGGGGSGDAEKRPNLSLEGMGMLSSCVSGSFLFLFEEVDDDDKLWTYKLDLCPLISKYCVVLDRTALQKYVCPSMISRKAHPRPLPTPDGKKIVVYSQYIRYNHFEYQRYGTEVPDFELLDTATGLCTALPPLVILYQLRSTLQRRLFPGEPKRTPWVQAQDVEEEDDKDAPYSFCVLQSDSWVEHCVPKTRGDSQPFLGSLYKGGSSGPGSRAMMVGCTFINNSNTFMVAFEVGVIFTLDLDSMEQGWKRFRGKMKAPGWDDFLFVDGLRMNPLDVSWCDKYYITHEFWLSPPPISMTNAPSYYITMLEYTENEKCIPCIMSSGIDGDTEHPFFICDVFHVDLSHGKKMEEPPHRLGSFKYVVNKKSPTTLFYPLGVFPFVV